MESFWWTTWGVIMTLVGVLLLFRYGMPFRARTGGAIFLICEETDEKDVVEEARYNRLGWFGLFLIVVGGSAQIYGAYLSAA